MPDPKRDQPSSMTQPKKHPMPEYDYQKPATGSFTARFPENAPRGGDGTPKKEPELQDLKFAV